MNEQIIFWIRNAQNVTTYRVIAGDEKVEEQMFDFQGENITQNFLNKEYAIYLAKCILKKYNENLVAGQISLVLTDAQAIALCNFLSEHAYPTMHEQPEIAAIFDELQKQVGM